MNGDQRKERPRGRFATVDEGGGDLIKCSGKYCRSCCGGYVADCVAVCCCPCAVLHCFALALLKGPCVVGRKCLGRKKKNKNKKNKKVNKRGHHHGGDDVVLERNTREGNSGIVCDSLGKIDSGFDGDKVWRELYQIRHLDFGRVSSSHDD
ncbi:uncharacterized protein LOC109814653 [Cajanus cajan]|uniref:Uncharacterized protein n=1 Tax=Cajanus cajan TaxID=3821 RepID=A0A151RYT7_CAJCA|nr:uncharacterized protein LOC109814653 [Cajanus cajan]KYP47702.1 hypothetical protein KK1_030653 [Cajanus cajan]